MTAVAQMLRILAVLATLGVVALCALWPLIEEAFDRWLEREPDRG